MSSRDNQKKVSKTENAVKRSKRLEALSQKKKKDESSDSEYFEESETENEELDVHEYRKLLSKLYPSKHINNKIKAGDKLKETLKNDIKNKTSNKKRVETESETEDLWETASEEEEEEKQEKIKSSNKKNNQPRKPNKKRDESESEESEEEDEEEEYDNKAKSKGSNKFNIIFTIGGKDRDDDYYDEDDEDYEDEDSEDEESETEDEDESVSTVSTESDDDSEEEEKEKEKEKEDRKKPKHKKAQSIAIPKETEEKSAPNLSTKEMLSKFKQMLDENPKDKSLQKCVNLYETEIKNENKKSEKKIKKQKNKNARIFRRIIKDKNMMNDYSFYEKLDVDEQKKIIKELKEINKITRVEKPYRMTLLETTMPTIFKAAAMKKINSLRYMETGSGEFYKIKNWVDTFMRIPFNKYETLPLTIEDGVEKCHDFMENAKTILDSAVYGLNDAKMQIMQMLGQLLTNPKAIGSAIAINGPPGTGKTSLVKEGISKILNRPFAFIALGGATDSSFLEGHSYTYEGSTWGKIVQILIDSKCMNPVIYFDELDKISDTPRGEEITGILTHLTDTSQNSQFHDKYFAEINFDLSKCLFIFSYNDETKVNPILKDRMYRIQTKGYNLKQKTVISNSYLLPKIREQVKFTQEDIIIPDETVHHIIDKHCNKEDGVRNLKRCLEIIHTKLNLYRLMKPGSNLFEEDMSLKVEFPFTVTKDIVDKLIKVSGEPLAAWHNMFI